MVTCYPFCSYFSGEPRRFRPWSMTGPKNNEKQAFGGCRGLSLHVSDSSPATQLIEQLSPRKPVTLRYLLIFTPWRESLIGHLWVIRVPSNGNDPIPWTVAVPAMESPSIVPSHAMLTG